MTEIIKRKNWSPNYKPERPRPPIAPKEFIIENVKFFSDECLHLKDLKIPEGFSYNDLYFEAGGSEYTQYVYVYTVKTKPNPKYEKDFIKYNKDLVKFDSDMIAWDAEIIEYNAWKKEYDDDLLKKQIAEAKKFLKKHGE